MKKIRKVQSSGIRHSIITSPLAIVAGTGGLTSMKNSYAATNPDDNFYVYESVAELLASEEKPHAEMEQYGSLVNISIENLAPPATSIPGMSVS